MPTPLNIKDPEAYLLARMISEATGKTLTRVVVDALRHEKERIIPRKVDMKEVNRILHRIDALPVLDPRSGKEILEDLYEENGMWK